MNFHSRQQSGKAKTTCFAALIKKEVFAMLKKLLAAALSCAILAGSTAVSLPTTAQAETVEEVSGAAAVTTEMSTAAADTQMSGDDAAATHEEETTELVYSGTCGDAVYWEFYESGTLYIYGSGTMENYIVYSHVPWYSSYSTKIKRVVIEDGVTEIGSYAFYGCTSLTSTTISDSVTEIGSYAFYGCTSLTTIAIPYSVTSIGSSAFFCCTSLTKIDVDSNNSVYASIGGVLFNKYFTKIICCPAGKKEEYTIPDSVTEIGSYAFLNCTSLTSIIIPNSVTEIGSYAFCACTSLTSTTIPYGATHIGNFTFASCTSLTSTTIPDSVTSIGSYAFRGCTSLISVTIPDSVTSIGDNAFSSCDSLNSLTIGNNVTSIGEKAFYNCFSLTDVYYTGTEEQWNEVSISSDNDPLTSATIHYNYVSDETDDTIDDGEDNETNDSEEETGKVGTILFDPGDWASDGDEVIYFYIWKIDESGNVLYGSSNGWVDYNNFGSKYTKGTEKDDGIWESYEIELNDTDSIFVIFVNNTTGSISSDNDITYPCVINTNAIGQTAYMTGNILELPKNSSKTNFEATFNIDGLGPYRQITSIGNIIGTCTAPLDNPALQIAEFAVEYANETNENTGTVVVTEESLAYLISEFDTTALDALIAIDSAVNELGEEVATADKIATATEILTALAYGYEYAPTSHTYIAAGTSDFFGSSWDGSDESNLLTLNEETGLYEKTYTYEAAAGETIEFMVTQDGSVWYGESGGGSSVSVAFDVEGEYSVVISFDPETGVPSCVTEWLSTSFGGNSEYKTAMEIIEKLIILANDLLIGTDRFAFLDLNNDGVCEYVENLFGSNQSIHYYDGADMAEAEIIYNGTFNSSLQTLGASAEETTTGEVSYKLFYDSTDSTYKTFAYVTTQEETYIYELSFDGAAVTITPFAAYSDTACYDASSNEITQAAYNALWSQLTDASLTYYVSVSDSESADYDLEQELVKSYAAYGYTPVALVETTGDVNLDGKVSLKDASLIQRYVAGLTTLTDEQITAADANGDGAVTTVDALTIIISVAAEA